MSGRIAAGLLGVVLIVVLCCVAGLGLGVGGAALASCAGQSPAPSAIGLSGGPTAPDGRSVAFGRWDSRQVGNAAVIVAVGRQLGLPQRAWVVAVATAMQESSLINLGDLGPGNDHDSLGLFQQRPSEGWGTASQVTDPAYAAARFYERLLRVPHWQSLPLAEAAQAVQRGAFPNAYARWEHDAAELVAAVGSNGSWAMAIDLEHCPSNCPTILSNSGGPMPVAPVATLQATANGDGGCTAGLAALARAETWLTAWSGGPVPYLSSADPATWFQGYRRDCSGYASMALGLPGPGLNSAGLAARGTPIAKTDLQAGDLLINPAPDLAGHVVIFDHWTDASMTSYIGYEQAGDGGTHHRTIPYPYFGGYQMKPYRL
jgi:hypothetical protein